MSVPPTAASLPPAIGIGPFPPANRWTSEAGQDYALIEGLEDMAPFFLNIVSSDDHWLFCASNGALSAGRGNADCALFPYETVDKIIESWNTTGPWTAMIAGDILWEPMRPATLPSPAVKRRLRKNVTGDEVVFEEEHEGLGLRFTYRWQCSARFGFVRRAQLENLGKRPVRLRLVDGLDNLMPPGMDKRMQNQLSCLADAYKLSELHSGGRLLVHRLAAGIIDRAVPLESLYATTVWAQGLDGARTCLTRGEAEEFLRGTAPRPASVVRGQRGAMFLARSLQLEAGDSAEWMFVAEVRQSQTKVSELARLLGDPEKLAAEVVADVLDDRARLQRRVATADGIQHGADRDATLHHYQNTLCNILRGGVPVEGANIRPQQFAAYLAKHHAPLRESHRSWLSHLPKVMPRETWLAEVRALGEPDLERLAVEYLPLVLSRRHGDPSRPWNRFDIRVRDESGERIQHFEGNWRDIFQNWEALAWSHPGYLDAFITKFLNASTIDGYNPYRISSDGLDWEVPDPEDPWATIGYWGDHQIIYLLKFLELQAKVRPDFLAGQLDRAAYVFADVPYRLCGWEETLADPRHTVHFDETRHAELMERKAAIGSDGLLLRDTEGNLCRVTLAEKLLLPAAVKLANLVPGGGIWMNTQRPEWNDANNALAGCGLSVVTAAYLLRYLAFVEGLIGDHTAETLSLSAHLADLIGALDGILADTRWQSDDANTRFELVSMSGRAAERHREQVYRDGPGETVELEREELLGFLRRAASAVRRTLQQNRRHDGLYHSYNVLEIDQSGQRMELARLSEMLEGQVAILTSGLLDAGEAADLLEALPHSRLYSTRHDSYLLYPDRDLPSFLAFNLVDEAQVFGIATLSEMLCANDHRILVPDSAGGFRFHPSLVNGYELAAALDRAGVSGKDREMIHALYESVFHHRAFTGRSGTMFAYEGLGCIYWHMVSKLMLASQEFALEADGNLRHRLAVSYYGIQRGLGFRKSPQDYGAFPAEAYSHSPGYAGAQQPGLTGQVKEGILCRFGELGVSFERGAIRFRPRLLRAAEFAADQGGDPTLSFTLAGTPVIYRCRESLNDAALTVRFSDGQQRVFPGDLLPAEPAAEVIRRTGRIESIDVELPADWLLH